MSVNMKLGVFQLRDGSVEEIVGFFPKSTMPWVSRKGVRYANGGLYAITPNPKDLVRYLGPLSTTPACADKAVTSPGPTVSTGMGGETLPPHVAKELSALHKENKELKRKLKEQPAKWPKKTPEDTRVESLQAILVKVLEQNQKLLQKLKKVSPSRAKRTRSTS